MHRDSLPRIMGGGAPFRVTCNRTLPFAQHFRGRICLFVRFDDNWGNIHLGAPMPVARITTRMDVGFVFCSFDFTNLHDEHEAVAVFDDAKRFVSEAAPNSLRILTDLGNTRMSAPVVAKLTELARHNAPFVQRSALVGLALVHRIALRQIIRLTGRDLREFKSRSDALAYLLGQ
jgi:hypothetical protein